MDLREIDKLVAEKVMGWHRDKDGDWYLPATHEGKLYPAYSGIPEYSTDIAAAWEVVEKVGALHFRLEQRGTAGHNWWCRMHPLAGSPGHAETTTAPLAISLAALKAKGVEVPG